MQHWWRSYRLLALWSMLRIRRELPFMIITQTLLAAGVVIGFTFFIPEATPEIALYLATGSMTVALITASMVIAPQIVSYRKREGLLDYQRSLPVPRMAALAADATVWVGMAVPGMVFSMIVATFRFDLDLSISPLIVLAVLLVTAGGVGVGYAIAYLVKPEIVGIITNVIVIAALMYAPINYPASRLPGWLAGLHEWLPFQYMAQAIRETVNVPPSGVPVLPFVVLIIWCLAGLVVASRIMTRRA